MTGENQLTSDPPLKRLSQKSGVKSISGDGVMDMIRENMESHIEEIMKLAVNRAKVAGRKTINHEDIAHGIFLHKNKKVIYNPKIYKNIKSTDIF